MYSVADGPGALHSKMADESFLIGTGPSATTSYLLQDEILHIAEQSGAQAIHPGYGFLSENADFCHRVSITPGLQFIGPGPSAITAMGKFRCVGFRKLMGDPSHLRFCFTSTREQVAVQSDNGEGRCAYSPRVLWR